jgi:hypothetical protein
MRALGLENAFPVHCMNTAHFGMADLWITVK